MPQKKNRAQLVNELNGKWNNLYSNKPYLKSIAISNGELLRGIKDSKLEFKFPLTVLCGPNGTGKTTFLALSVLGFHDHESLTLNNSNKGYYDFSHFFGFSEREKHKEGIKISWEYTDGSNLEITKGRERWLRYIKNDGTPKRPERGVEFVGLSRIVPAFEKRGYKQIFGKLKKYTPKAIATDVAKYLTQILSKTYNSVITYENKNSAGVLSLNDYNETHTSFNAGAGEECLTNIISNLLTAKDGSIVAIEEIEIGLHPAAMRPLVDAILEIISNKNLQVIITTHSPDFLRCCPPQSLIQCERSATKVNFLHNPNIENAVYNLSGTADSHVYIVCEDVIAKTILLEIMNNKQRMIANVKGYGGKTELLGKAKFIKELTNKNVLIVWDADVEDHLLTNAENGGFYAIKLPGTNSPDKHICDLIINDNLKEKIVDSFSIEDAEWQTIKNKISSLTDHHEVFYWLAMHLNQSEDSVTKEICKIYTRKLNADFLPLREKIHECINAYN